MGVVTHPIRHCFSYVGIECDWQFKVFVVITPTSLYFVSLCYLHIRPSFCYYKIKKFCFFCV